MRSTLSSKGQITVPKAIRDRLRLGPGDELQFVVNEDGSIRVIPISGSLRQLRGVLAKPDRAVSVEDMERAIARGAGGG